MIRKHARFLSTIMTLAMVVGVMPAITLNASAETVSEAPTIATTVTVGGIRLNSGEYAFTNASGAVTKYGADENNYNLKFENGTLTLSDAGITAVRPEVSCIYAAGDLTVVLKGSNTLTSAAIDCGIEITEDLLITGSGILNTYGGAYAGICSLDGNIEAGGKARVEVHACNNGALRSDKGDITITGGASVKACDGAGLYAPCGDIMIDGGAGVDISNCFTHGIDSLNGDITVSGGSIVNIRDCSGIGITSDINSLTIGGGSDVKINNCGEWGLCGVVTISGGSNVEVKNCTDSAITGNTTISDRSNVKVDNCSEGIYYDEFCNISGGSNVEINNCSRWGVTYLIDNEMTISGSAVTVQGENGAINGEFSVSSELCVKEGETSTSAAVVSGKSYVNGNTSDAKYVKVCKPDPVVSGGSGSGSASTITVPVSGDTNVVHVNADVSGSKASVKEITREDIAEAAGGKTEAKVTIDLSRLGKNINEVTLTNNSVKNLAASEAVTIAEFKLSNAVVSADGKTLTALIGQAGIDDITLHCDLINSRKMNSSQQKTVSGFASPVVIDSYFTCNGRRISDFKGGKAVLAVKYDLPAGRTAGQVAGFFVDEKGKKTSVPCKFAEGIAYVTASHFSYYVVSADGDASSCAGGEDCPSKAFTDIDTSEWYHEATDFVISKGLMNGVKEKVFSPEGNISRAMFVTILWRQAGSPAADYAMSFKDVTEGKWYTEAVRWAASKGIVDGYNAKRFGPDDSITREQLAKIVYNFEKKINNGGFTGTWMFDLEFSDADKISDYADEAMHWCVMNNVINGFDDGTLAPGGTETRARAAQILMNYLTITADRSNDTQTGTKQLTA